MPQTGLSILMGDYVNFKRYLRKYMEKGWNSMEKDGKRMEIHGNRYIHIQKTLAFVDFSALLCFFASHVPKYKLLRKHLCNCRDSCRTCFRFASPEFQHKSVKFPGNLHSAGVWVQYDWFRVDSWTDPVDFNHIEDPLWTDHGPRRHLRQRTRFATVSLWIRTSSKKKPCACTVIVWKFHTCYWPVGQFPIYGFVSPVNFHVGDFPTFEYTRVDPPYEPREWIQTRGSKGAFKDT